MVVKGFLLILGYFLLDYSCLAWGKKNIKQKTKSVQGWEVEDEEEQKESYWLISGRFCWTQSRFTRLSHLAKAPFFLLNYTVEIKPMDQQPIGLEWQRIEGQQILKIHPHHLSIAPVNIPAFIQFFPYYHPFPNF